MNDLDTSDKTVTFEATTGVAVYGIVTDVTNTATVLSAIPVEAPAAEATETEAAQAEVEVTVEDKEAVLIETPAAEAETVAAQAE